MGRRACVTPCLETPCTADTHTNNPSTPKLSSAPDTPNSLVDQDVSIRSVLQFAHQHTQRADSQGMKLQAPAEGSGPPEDSIEDSSLPRGDVESLRESQTSAPSLSTQFPGAQLSTTDNVGIPTDGGRVSDSVSSRCIPSRASHTRYAHTNAPQTPATVPEIQAQTPQQLYPDTAALIRTNNEAAFPHDVSNLSIRDIFNENTSNHQDYYGVDDPTASWTYSDACAIPYGTDRHHTENDNRGMATPPSTLHTPVAPLCSPDEDSATGLPLPPPMITPSTPTAESVGGSVVTLASSTSSMQPQSARSKPVLYSAIGSLEDPNSTSFASWRDKKSWRNRPKIDFPSTHFLKPVNSVNCVTTQSHRPVSSSGMVYGLKQIRHVYEIPTEAEIYEFGHQLFKTVQLSSECSIVCLIYIERLMELAKVPLLASTWRPIFMCGLLLASKVWQDLSSWNIEFASVYPQYSLSAINRLEHTFLRMIKWELYISSSSYAKYYFALRSLTEKSDFRQRYNRMVGGVNCVQAAEARKIEQRSTQVKEEALLQLSRSWNG